MTAQSVRVFAVAAVGCLVECWRNEEWYLGERRQKTNAY